MWTVDRVTSSIYHRVFYDASAVSILVDRLYARAAACSAVGSGFNERPNLLPCARFINEAPNDIQFSRDSSNPPDGKESRRRDRRTRDTALTDRAPKIVSAECF
jgi:hypothetical protein